jgi:sodium/hydrogen exchanger-like protein 6/7
MLSASSFTSKLELGTHPVCSDSLRRGTDFDEKRRRRTLSKFHGDDVFVSSFFHGVAIFLLQFSISMALGVAFGLVTSLVLKHSHLNLYPGIESCIVTLVAFTSYFLSTGMHMSGVVSLLFCGITLKHYAYHSMSRRTQRTTKYMFSILAQLSENFIFIYLGLNLFAQEIQVFKPLFILVTAISVTAARYAAVFPLSEIINWIFHARGQRHEELPHSYQMMLFWAGLRGAVGVALAVGLTGENADALRTTVLVVVVLTVIIFGGTTARMLEVLGIRVGVEEEDESSDEEGGDVWTQAPGAMALQVGPGSRRYANRTGRGGRAARGVALGGGAISGGGYVDDADDSQPPSPVSTPRLGHYRTGSAGFDPYNAGQPPRSANATLARGYSAASSSEEDASDDGEAFPTYDGAAGSRSSDPLGAEESGESPAPREGMVFRDGQWFTNLDERYLLPLFTNSVASRRHHAKKASRKATGLSRRESDMHLSGTASPTYGGGVDLGEAFDEQEEDVASARHGLLGALDTADIDGDSENGKAKGSSSRLKSTFRCGIVSRRQGSPSKSRSH